jgi:hypothetical protein
MAKFARTLNEVEKKLRNTSLAAGQPGTGTTYLACRYAPFSAESGKMSVPDGIGSNITTRDYLGTYDIITPSTGSLDINILPFIPMQISTFPSSSGSNYTVNGKVCTRLTNTMPVPFGPDSMTIFRHGDTPATSDYISSGRIISVGFRLYYTGAAAACQGLIQADTFPISADHDPVLNSTSILKSFNPAGTAYPDTTTFKYVSLDMPKEVVTTNRYTVITRPEAGLTGILKRKVRAEAHTFKSYQETGVYLITDDYSNAVEKSGTVYAGFSGDALDSWGLLTLYDTDFDVTRLRIVGNNLSYRLEVMTCIQFCHHPNFSLIALTSKAGESNDKTLAEDDKINAKLTAAVPLGAPLVPLEAPKQRRPRRRVGNTSTVRVRTVTERVQNDTKTKGNNGQRGGLKNNKGNK